MSQTWRSEEEPAPVRITPLGWVRVVLRGLLLALGMLVGMIVLLPLRLVERRIHGTGRPWTPFVVQSYCRFALFVLGLKCDRIGAPLIRPPGAAVANHAAWLDIFVINAVMRVTFVSKSDVADWPVIGFIAKAAGTRFITRNAREAGVQRALMQGTLGADHIPLFFPEGTSTDGARVLPFKSSLFAAIFEENQKRALQVQPLSVIYHAPAGQDARFFGWWGDMSFGAHALKVLAQAPQGRVTVLCHAPLAASDFADRKSLAKASEALVRQGHETHYLPDR